MSLEVRITMPPKDWDLVLAVLSNADKMAVYNPIEVAVAEAKRSKQLATIIKNKKQQKARIAGLVQVDRVDL